MIAFEGVQALNDTLLNVNKQCLYQDYILAIHSNALSFAVWILSSTGFIGEDILVLTSHNRKKGKLWREIQYKINQGPLLRKTILGVRFPVCPQKRLSLHSLAWGSSVYLS